MGLVRNVVSYASTWATTFVCRTYPEICKNRGKKSFARCNDVPKLENIISTRMEGIACNLRI